VLGALLVLGFHLLHQVVVHERALLKATWHDERLLPLLLAATTDDQPVARLVRLSSAAFLLTGRVHRVPATGGLALTTTVRVVDRVHGDTADGRALALPPHAARLAPADVRLLGVADLADRRPAAQVHHAHLTGRHAQRAVLALLGQQLDARARAAGDLGAAAGPQLDGVQHGAGRDVAQRQVVARLDVGVRPVLDPVALLQAPRGEDVALLAVEVVQQRDAGRAVRVVLDVRDLRRDAVLVVPPEVDHAVGALVPAALVPGRYAAVVVAAALLGERTQQRLLRLAARDLDEVGHAGAATTRSRRLVVTDAHLIRSSLVSPPAGRPGQAVPPKMSIRSPSARLTIARLVSLRLP